MKGPVHKGGCGVFKPLFIFPEAYWKSRYICYISIGFRKRLPTAPPSSPRFFWLELHHSSVVRNTGWQLYTSLVKTTITKLTQFAKLEKSSEAWDPWGGLDNKEAWGSCGAEMASRFMFPVFRAPGCSSLPAVLPVRSSDQEPRSLLEMQNLSPCRRCPESEAAT